MRDPRHFQIAVVAALLLYGVSAIDFGISAGRILILLSTTALTQWVATRLTGAAFDPRSPVISGLSLGLLARSNSILLLVLAAIVAIASKFLIRSRRKAGGAGKHIFNPTNFALVFMVLLSGGKLWVSPDQWGNGATLSLFLGCAGMAVVHRAARSDVTWAFLGAYAAILVGRALWLGDPLSIALHGLNREALLIFAFFMISDPKTTPDSRAGRILYATLIAVGTAVVHFVLFRSNGLLWSLAVLAPSLPLIDRHFGPIAINGIALTHRP